MPFNGLTPAQYVQHLLTPGISTIAGPVPLSAYVSTDPTRFTRAQAVLRFFNQLLHRLSNSTVDHTVTGTRAPHRYPGVRLFAAPIVSDGAIAVALNHLETMYQAIVATGGPNRVSNWRRIFTGQGLSIHIREVMNYIVRFKDVLRAPVVRGGTSPFEPYFVAPPLAALHRMVADQIFGLDCLGFVGTYLVYCGREPRYPEVTQEQYAGLGFRGVSGLDDIEARCVVLWLDPGMTKHIGIIDSVTGRGDRRLTVDLCQSSRGGPQVNRGVTLVPEGRYQGSFGQCASFRLTGGVPPSPVVGVVEVGKRANW